MGQWFGAVSLLSSVSMTKEDKSTTRYEFDSKSADWLININLEITENPAGKIGRNKLMKAHSDFCLHKKSKKELFPPFQIKYYLFGTRVIF